MGSPTLHIQNLAFV